MNAQDLPWTDVGADTYFLVYGDVEWYLAIEWLSKESLERKYWLNNYKGLCQQIHTQGGLYTALDIATEYITGLDKH
jgi:hypothetical protein